MAAKTICNETEYDIDVILYIGGRSNGAIEAFGTRRVSLAPGQVKDVDFGDVRHSYLNGVEFCSLIQGALIKSKVLVQQCDSELDRFLNSDDCLSITPTGIAGCNTKLEGAFLPKGAGAQG